MIWSFILSGFIWLQLFGFSELFLIFPPHPHITPVINCDAQPKAATALLVDKPPLAFIQPPIVILLGVKHVTYWAAKIYFRDAEYRSVGSYVSGYAGHG
jgi:hypothetical protein